MPDRRPPSEREIFLAALDCTSPAERAQFLRRACAGDHALRAAVEALLAHHLDDSFLEIPPIASPPHPPKGDAESAPPPAKPLPPPPADPTPGSRIGPYKLLESIGEGGSGIVFMAEQQEPVRRRVALKVIKAGMDTKSVIARFETERQALALMDHPNIARVLDAGSTASGRPYFVMELVRGTRINAYCDANHLSTRQRLRLFIQVCHAIQHAHQKGIIHRDIKPSNILVTLHDGVPVPKVIDFGIAKAVGQRLTEITVFTEFHAFIGTPAYMSPEQAEMSGLDIDTRTDVYSLGVLLYEILTGRPPFDPQELAASGLDGMRRTIRERDPLAPSTRLRTLVDADRTSTAARHRVEPARLESTLRGDLDWIVLRALEKDRTRRYPTPGDLAHDVQCYLDEEPIAARPPSAWYRFHKFTRRHRLATAATAAFAAALLIGAALAAWQYQEKGAALARLQSSEAEERRLRELAERARARESELRRLAQSQELRARRRAYAADVSLAQQALASDNLARARELLGRQIPGPAEPDLRGWEWRHLWKLCGSEALFALPTQPGEVTRIAISPDRQTLAAATSAGTVTLTDLRSRQEIRRFAFAGSRPQIAFSPSAPILAIGAPDPHEPGPSSRPGPRPNRHRLRLWNTADARFTTELPLDGSCVHLAFSPEGARLAAVTSEGAVLIWSIANPEAPPVAHSLPGYPRIPASVTLSSDLRLAAYSTGGGQLRLLDLPTTTVLHTLQAGTESARSLAFSPDASRLAAGGSFSESTIRLFDTRSGTLISRLQGHRGWISGLAWWPDGRTLTSTSADQTLRIWATENPPPAGPAPESEPPADPASDSQLLDVLRGHQLEVWCLDLAAETGLAATGSKDGTLLVWDVKSRKSDRSFVTLPEPSRAWAFTADSSSIRSIDSRGRIVRRPGPDFRQAIPEHTLEPPPADFPFGPQVYLSSDARVVVHFPANDKRARAWNLERSEPIDTTRFPSAGFIPLGFLPETHRFLTRDVTDGRVLEWDLDRVRLERTWNLSLIPETPPFVVPSPDGSWFFAAGEAHAFRVVHPASAADHPVECGPIRPFTTVFSPDASRFAFVGGSGIAEIWQTSPPRRLSPITGFIQGISSVAFSRDGSRLLIGSDHREALKIWDAVDLHELYTLAGTGSAFSSPTFSPDGNLLAAQNRRGIVHVWRAATAEEIASTLPALR